MKASIVVSLQWSKICSIGKSPYNRENWMDALISIKPKYVKEIINQTKFFEYRKKAFLKNINRVYIYSSSPQKEIIGFFPYQGFLEGTPAFVWNQTKDFSGITETEFFKYFIGKEKAFAIIISELYIFDKPINPWINSNFIPPQSYRYISQGEYDEKLCSLVQRKRKREHQKM